MTEEESLEYNPSDGGNFDDTYSDGMEEGARELAEKIRHIIWKGVGLI